MNILTVEKLQQIIPSNDYVEEWYEALEQLLPEYEINTKQRIAGFLSQCAHESKDFTKLKENLNYRWETLRKVFPKYFATDAIAQNYASKKNKQEAIANRAYANRNGNGPESSGDGFRYCGRGIIQITGKDNYQAFADSIETPIEEIADYLMTFEGAVQGACWYWEANDLNRFCDKEDITGLSRAINGGDNGLEDRIEKYKKTIKILNG